MITEFRVAPHLTRDELKLVDRRDSAALDPVQRLFRGVARTPRSASLARDGIDRLGWTERSLGRTRSVKVPFARRVSLLKQTANSH